MSQELSWLQALVLGISQGLTEFLPISSSAHTLIISKLAGWPDPGAAFTAVTQIGTELAVLIYFRKDLSAILRSWFRATIRLQKPQDDHAKLGWYIIIGSVPIAILGVTFKEQIETTARNLYLVSFSLIVMGLLLGLFDRIAKHTKDFSNLNIRHGLIFGIGQALALIPGVSRSGATITFGLALGYKRDFAARYSFLLAIPAVLGSGLYTARDIGTDDFVNWPATLLATGIAFIVGYLVISALMNYLKTRSFAPFVIYRVLLGSAILLMLQLGYISS